MLCIKCGHNNPPDSNYCQKCNAVLYKMAQTKADPPPKVNERYNQLKNAGDRVKSGEWTVDEYSDFLVGISNALTQKEMEIREIEIPEESYEDFREELEIGFSGIELYNQGISEMRLYTEDLDPGHIDYGLELIDEGNERINEAMRINRENRQEIEEMNIDTSTFM